MKLLGIDPGKTTGWAVVEFHPDSRKIVPLDLGTTVDQSLLELQDHIQAVDLVVFENFRIRPKHARQGTFDWDPMITPQVIGALKLLCQIHNTPIVEQSPDVKPMGFGWMKQKYEKGKKNVHMQDALAHVVFYLVKHKSAKPFGV